MDENPAQVVATYSPQSFCDRGSHMEDSVGKDNRVRQVQDLIIDLITSNPGIAGIGASLISVATGTALMIDDAYDFGKDGFERNPPIPHHYVWGALLMIGGLAGLGASLLNLVADLVGSDPTRLTNPFGKLTNHGEAGEAQT